MLSPSRFDRLPLHFDRWKGPMSIAVQINEEEIENAITTISTFNRTNIRFTFYIVKNQNENPRCSFVTMKNVTVKYDTCFVINELRNLAIETIQTSHYLIVDADGIVSCNYSLYFQF